MSAPADEPDALPQAVPPPVPASPDPEAVRRVYPWLHIVTEEYQIWDIDMQGITGAECDRRLVIAQELRAGRVVVNAEAPSDPPHRQIPIR